jgi:EmrB/QacA subfamily drug resistance transporter
LNKKQEFFLLKYHWLVLTVTTIGVLMAGIDTRIVIIGLPQVAVQLKADPEQLIWITQSYVLASTVMLLLIGRLADIFGRVRIFTAGFAIFTIGSGLTSLGQDPLQVILFRALQGVGAALILTNAVAIITDVTPKHKLGVAIGINQVSFRAGAVIGLTLSGLILSFLDWRALFYINLPIGILGTYWSHHSLKEVADLEKEAKIDWIGFVAFFVFILNLLLVFTFGAYGLSQNETTIYGLLAISVVSLAAFFLRQRKAKSPLLDLGIFKIRDFSAGIIAILLNAIAWAAVLLLLSLEFQLSRHSSPLRAGIEILPFEVAFLATGPLSGFLSDRFGHRKFTVSGITLSSIALLLFYTTSSNAPYSILAFHMIVLGLGTGLFLAPNIRTIMDSVPLKRRGIGSATMLLFFNLGLTLSLNVALLAMSLTAPYPLISKIISTVNPGNITPLEIALFSDSLKNTYLWLAVINSLAIFPLLISGNRKKSSSQNEEEKPREVLV